MIAAQQALDDAYQRFLILESEFWRNSRAAAFQRYAWQQWYRPSASQFRRLVADVAGGERLAGGLPVLGNRVKAALEGIPTEHLIPVPMPIANETDTCALPALAALGQLVCDEPSRWRVASEVRNDFPYGGRVAFLGDDDLVSLVLAQDEFPTVVYDIDDRIGELTRTQENITYVHHDVREPWTDAPGYDAVLLDPADGSVALSAWFERLDEILSAEEGARAYLSVNPWRLGRRWGRVLEQFTRMSLIPVRMVADAKNYPTATGNASRTDLWVFERTLPPTALPTPYFDIEVFR